MAGATVTASTVDVTPRQQHAGNYAVHFKYNLNGTTISTNDIIMMGYIPQGVTVLDGYIWGAVASLGTFDFGTSASISALSTAITCSAASVNHFIGVPRTFSLSADAQGNLRVGIFAKCAAGTGTVTGSLNLVLICTSDPVIP